MAKAKWKYKHHKFRQIVRKLNELAETKGCKIIFEEGESKPRIDGSSYHWTNRSGETIHHPSAYSKKGWSSIVYNSSTLGVYVGKDWFDKWLKPSEKLQLILLDRNYISQI